MADFFFLLQNIWFHFSVPQLWKRTSQKTFATLTTQRAAGRESPPSSSSLTGSERICRGVHHLLSKKLPLADIGEAGKCVSLHSAYINCLASSNKQWLRLAQLFDLNLKIFLWFLWSECVFRGQMMCLKSAQQSWLRTACRPSIWQPHWHFTTLLKAR